METKSKSTVAKAVALHTGMGIGESLVCLPIVIDIIHMGILSVAIPKSDMAKLMVNKVGDCPKIRQPGAQHKPSQCCQ